jgi:hypothetical protein
MSKSSNFTKRFPKLRPGEYEEIGIPDAVLDKLPEGVSVRMFATPSLTDPTDGYYIQAIKAAKAGWGNGTAVLACNCLNAQFQWALILLGLDKASCKHAKGLRQALKRGL